MNIRFINSNKPNKIQHYNKQTLPMIQHNTLVAQLMDLLEEIAQNTHYPYFFNSERCLAEPSTYFELCQYIFPDLKPQIYNIFKDRKHSPVEELNSLLALLADVLRIDLSKVEASEIMKFNLNHINRLVAILYEASKIIKDSSKRRHKLSGTGSQDIFNLPKVEIDKPASARDKINRDSQKPQKADEMPRNMGKQKKQNYVEFIQPESQQPNNQSNNQEIDDHSQDYPKDEQPSQAHQEKRAKVKKSKKALKKKGRSGRAGRQNLHQNIVNTIMNEKTRMLKAEARDNRKNKYEEVERAKEQYRSYLQAYTKQNKNTHNREKQLKKRSQSAVKPLKQELPLEDFDKIDKFFQSFAYQFRDKKTAYIRKLSQLIHKQEIDRYCYHNRIERETKQYMQKQLAQELQAARHQHRVKSEVVRQNAKSIEEEVNLLKKQEIKLASRQRKELREAKKLQLQRIQYVLRSDNERVLMGLQQGGRLQKIILKMYKKL